MPSSGGAAVADRTASAPVTATSSAPTLVDRLASAAARHGQQTAAADDAHRLQLLTRERRRFAELEAALPDFSRLVDSSSESSDSSDSSDSEGDSGHDHGDGRRHSLSPSALLASGGRLLERVSSRTGVGGGLLGRISGWRGDASGAGADGKASTGTVTAKKPAKKPARKPAKQVTREGLPVTSHDSVWLLDNVAYEVDAATTVSSEGASTTTTWRAEYVVAVLAQHPTCRVMDAVRAVADRLGADVDDDAALQTIEARIRPFLQDVRPGRQVAALYGGAGDGEGASGPWPLLLGPSDRHGLSRDVRALPASAAGTLVATTAQVPAGADGLLRMRTFFAGRRGWGVISDIDDTIKRTQTSDPVGILQTTFMDVPVPIDGMPALYATLRAQMGGGAPFFYLSASPYSLYPFLRRFRQQHYPPGMLLLRDATPMSVAGLLATLTVGTQAYKVGRMRALHAWLPERRFVCVGDSTQSDPEAYGEIYREFPGWVGLILIRKVTDIAALGLAEKNDPARFERAFAGVPPDAWHVFEDPAECYERVQLALDVGVVDVAALRASPGGVAGLKSA